MHVKIKHLSYDRISNVLIAIMLFGYLGAFNRYRMIPTYLMCFALIMLIFLKTKMHIKVDKKVMPWVIILFYVFISAALFNTSTGFSYSVMLFNGILLIVFSKSMKSYEQLTEIIQKVSLVFLAFTIANYVNNKIIITLFGFMMSQGQINTFQFDLNYGGIPGLAGESSYNAFCMMLGVIVSMAKCFWGEKDKRTYNIIYMIALYIGIILTGKRSFMLLIGALLSIILFMQLIWQQQTKKKVIFFLIGVIIVLCLFPYVYTMVVGILTKGGETINLSNRQWFWNMAMELYEKHPIRGNGINTYDFLYNARKSSAGYVPFAGAHNSYLQFLGELGIIGFGLYISAIFWEVKRAVINAKKSICGDVDSANVKFISLIALLGIIFCLLYALSENPFYQPQQLFAFFVFSNMSRTYEKEYLG